METELQKKKSWLDNLFYKKNKQRDFFVCGTYGNRKFTKWKTYLSSVAIIDVLNLENNNWKDLEYFKQINQRQIFQHEIVLDIEDPNQLKPIIKQLKKWMWKDWFVYSTGSRGYHIHIYFDIKISDNDMSTIEKAVIIKKFDTDMQKCSEKNLIALEGFPHWKTGNLKEIIEYG